MSKSKRGSAHPGDHTGLVSYINQLKELLNIWGSALIRFGVKDWMKRQETPDFSLVNKGLFTIWIHCQLPNMVDLHR